MSAQSRVVWKSMAAGALGGLAGSWIMNQFQSLWASTAKELANGQVEEDQGQDENATVKTARAISERVLHHNLTSEEVKWAGPVVHYALGTLLGTAYGAFAERAPVACAGYGAVYGSAVWLAADEFAVPAFGLSKPPQETPASSHVQALASHLVYGITTDLIRRALVNRVEEHKSGRLSGYFS
jgi:putative membrane protein